MFLMKHKILIALANIFVQWFIARIGSEASTYIYIYLWTFHVRRIDISIED
jgi:hypothetical protein